VRIRCPAKPAIPRGHLHDRVVMAQLLDSVNQWIIGLAIWLGIGLAILLGIGLTIWLGIGLAIGRRVWVVLVFRTSRVFR
jgi:hypothetical protein